MNNNTEIVVIGAGHAGIEASVAAARMGCRVSLVSMDINAIGRMSCNPAIGGTAKGHLVREIDALGGVMGILADKTGIQFKMLNKSKGPAVWSPRCQSDKDLYSYEAAKLIAEIENIEIIQDMVKALVVEGVSEKSTGYKFYIKGVKTELGRENQLQLCYHYFGNVSKCNNAHRNFGCYWRKNRREISDGVIRVYDDVGIRNRQT